jgi:hypothetical protein
LAAGAFAEKQTEQRQAGRNRDRAAVRRDKVPICSDNYRESSDSPMLKAFCRVAPSVLLSFFAICEALVFLRAIVFRSRSSPEVHARRFFFLFAIKPPFQERLLVSLTEAKEKPRNKNLFADASAVIFSTNTYCRSETIVIGLCIKNFFLVVSRHYKTQSAPPRGRHRECVN